MKAVGSWVLLAAALGAASAAAAPARWEGVDWEQRWAAADSLWTRAGQVAHGGDLPGALELLDQALAAHPSHFRSWSTRWAWQIRMGLTDDLPIVEEGDGTPDRAYVLSLGRRHLERLTGDDGYRSRRLEALASHLRDHPDDPRAFGLSLDLAEGAADAAEARRWYAAARQRLPYPAALGEVAAAMARRDRQLPFLDAAEVDSVSAWWERGAAALATPADQAWDRLQHALWRGRRALSRVGDLEATQTWLQEAARQRRLLDARADDMRRRGVSGPAAPFAVADATADVLRADLKAARGEGFAASAYYRTAWGRIRPLVEPWSPVKAYFGSPELVELRERLLPLVAGS